MVQMAQKTGEIVDSSSANRETKYKKGKHPNSLKNLTPFEQGVSGNPSGKPSKEDKFRKALNDVGNIVPQAIFDEPDFDIFPPKNERTNRELVLFEIWTKAKWGHIEYIKLLAKTGCLY